MVVARSFCAALCCLLALPACRSRGALVVVDVDSMPAIVGISRTHATVNALSTTREFDLEPPTPVSTPFSFGIDLPPSSSGPISIHLVCFDASGNQLGEGDGSSTIRAAAETDIAISIGEPTTDLLAPSDFGTVDLKSSPDMTIVPFQSCVGLAANCGAAGNDDCCNSLTVPGGTFYRADDVGADQFYVDTSDPATVSSFQLDRYEVTVARFRKFVNAGMGTQANPPASTTGARRLNGASNQAGWSSNWNTYLASDTNALTTALSCDSSLATWTDNAAANENRPINCITWYEAFAFCVWDGGYLPTDAEWNYVASAGSEQRAFPWSSPPGSLTIDNTYTVYGCTGGCTVSDIGLVGSKAPKGDGKWGHSDLAGNVAEWTLDFTGNYQNPCDDCAQLTPLTPSNTVHIVHNDGFEGNIKSVRSPGAYTATSDTRSAYIGVRCARAK